MGHACLYLRAVCVGTVVRVFIFYENRFREGKSFKLYLYFFVVMLIPGTYGKAPLLGATQISLAFHSLTQDF